jgi:hypothetical protein
VPPLFTTVRLIDELAVTRDDTTTYAVLFSHTPPHRSEKLKLSTPDDHDATYITSAVLLDSDAGNDVNFEPRFVSFVPDT